VVLPELEQQLTLLSRRMAKPIQLHGPSGFTVLDRPAYLALVRVYDDGPLRITSLAALLEVDLSVASRQVKALEDAGFVRRAPDPADARAALVSATDAGQSALELVRAQRREVLGEVLGEWLEEDQESFVRLLRAFNAGLDAAIARRTTED
jgi:DNA-binding MarR family transcriptional regulator